MSYIEGSIQRLGNQIRIRLRLCKGIYVYEAFRKTFHILEPVAPVLYQVREFIPKEFQNDPKVKATILDPIEEIWAHRVRHHYIGFLM